MSEPVHLDRRHRRRQETIEEIVDVAIEVMTEQGVGGLSLGEVARRVGIRTPSLYVYFESKHAVYDAVFTRGWQSVHQTMLAIHGEAEDAPDLPTYLQELAATFVRWMVEHPVQAELMSWRPVPGYEPSPPAYAAAVDAFAAARGVFAQLRRRGLFRPDVETEHVLQAWTVLLSGVMTQQLANAPHEPFDEGRFTTMLPEFVAMFLTHFGHQRPPRARGKA